MERYVFLSGLQYRARPCVAQLVQLVGAEKIVSLSPETPAGKGSCPVGVSGGNGSPVTGGVFAVDSPIQQHPARVFFVPEGVETGGFPACLCGSKATG